MNPWLTYTTLHESLNKVNLINADLHFTLTNGNRLQGLLSDFVIDGENLFLSLKSVTINEDKFDEFNLVGLDIYRWRVARLAPRLTSNQKLAKESKQSAFGTATFDGPKSSTVYNSSATHKILIDKSALPPSTSTESRQQSGRKLKEVDLIQDDDYVAIDLAQLQLPASNTIELIHLKSLHSSNDLQEYYDRCSEIVNLLKAEAMIGFAIFPQNDENLLNTYNNTVDYVNSLNRQLFMHNVLSSLQYTYFCFSTAGKNYAFLFTNISDEDASINEKVFQDILKPLFESAETQKIVCGCTLISGILWHKYHISLTNVCDLQLVDRQIQKINIVHRKRPYSKYAPPPNVNILRTCSALIAEYLGIPLVAPNTVTNWANFTNKVGNVIRVNIIFLRELSARMNYELLHYMFAYSTRTLLSLRSASNKEVDALTSKFTVDEYYRKILEQPMFDAEKGIHFALNLNKVFPLRYYDPTLFFIKKQ